MFAAVMMDPENCRHLLEMILNISIERVEVDIEKSIVYHPEYHGIRLDVFSKDEKNTRYSVEMQVNPTPVTQRSRYYHSEIDAGLLLAGASYDNLPDAYVIFICDYDPFQDRKYVYTVTTQIKETGRPYNDGSHTIILSTLGENKEEVAPELVAFLNFVHAGLKESEADFQDGYVRQLQSSVAKIKNTREMAMRYMVLERLLREEKEEGIEEGRKEGHEEGRKEGREEGLKEGRTEAILLFLSTKGTVPTDLKDHILAQKDPDVVKQLILFAAEAKSIEDFAARAEGILQPLQENAASE